MILAVDVAYRKKTAMAGGIVFSDWTDAVPLHETVISCPVPDEYVPGGFYRRELPCITALLKHMPLVPDCIVIDGFVYLGRNRNPGLGKHLRNFLQDRVAVVGVAKTYFRDTPKSCEVMRGGSRRPLYITADGIAVNKAKLSIAAMHGTNRIPTLLKYVDRLCRKPSA